MHCAGLLLWSRYFGYWQVLSASGRFLDSVESRGTTEIVSRYGQSGGAEVQGLRIVSGEGYWK